MGSLRTEISEIVTGLGLFGFRDLDRALAARPRFITNVDDEVFDRLDAAHAAGTDDELFHTAWENGRRFARSDGGLRGRPPWHVEWKGPHRPPAYEQIPADLRVDHVYLVSCKYLSRVLLNPGPQRLFERLLIGESRQGTNWFLHTAAPEFQNFYESAVGACGFTNMPASVADLDRTQQRQLKDALRGRVLPATMQPPWRTLCNTVATETSRRWDEELGSTQSRLRLLWRLLRVSGGAYFVLGTDKSAYLRFRIDSAWDWMQSYDLRRFTVFPRDSGQPEVGWQAVVRRRTDSVELDISGHVEIRWSHGRFYGVPEAKVYLDTAHAQVPGYNPLV